MKKKLLSLLLCGALFAMLFPAQALPSRVVRVGFFDYAGFLEKKADGRYSGYCYDYLQEIASHTGWTYEFVYGSWEECVARLDRGEIDVLCGAQYSQERAERFLYSDLEAGVEYAALLVPEDRQDVYYDDYPSFEGLRVGQLRGNYQNDYLSDFALENGFTYDSVICDTVGELQSELQAGEIDAILISSLQRLSGEKAVARFAPTPFYFIIGEEKAGLKDEMDRAMEQIQISDAAFATRLYSRYYGESSEFHTALTREEAQFVQNSPTLRVAAIQGWEPLSYWDEEGSYSGVCARIMEVVSKRSGLRFEYLPAQSEAEAARMVREGEADLLCPLSERYAQEAQFPGLAVSKPFFAASVTLAMGEGTELAQVKQVAVPMNIQALNTYVGERYPELIRIAYPDATACIEAVRRGEADAMVENVFALEQYRKLHDYEWLEPVLSDQSPLSLTLGVGEAEDEALRPLLNKIISQFDQETINSLVLQSTMSGSQITLLTAVRPLILPTLAVLAALVLLVSLRARRRAEKLAFLDPVTGRQNKNRFLLQAHRQLKNGIPGYWMISLDIDRFKLINDMHGYEMGDQILKSIADLFAQSMGSGEYFCRESNDLFVLLLHSSGERMRERLPAMLELLNGLPQKLNKNFRFAVSCGVYELRDGDRDVQKAIVLANIAREQAKAHRQNWISYYSDEMRQQATREQEIVNHMEEALKNGEFQVYYQPKVGLSGEHVVGAEALVRWIGEDGIVVGPDEFIPVFEANGFITKLDIYVFEQVCRQLRIWLDAGNTPCPISVNLSRVHLNKEDFYLQYFAIMKKYRIQPQFIELELTESAIFENKLLIAELMCKVKTMGMIVSIDDFGSGYSSLNLLKDLQFDYLKLDKEFLNESSDNERGRRVIQSVIYLADKLNMMVVAEGVETQEQVDFLRKAHCGIVQGYYYSRPLPLRQFEAFCGFSVEREAACAVGPGCGETPLE